MKFGKKRRRFGLGFCEHEQNEDFMTIRQSELRGMFYSIFFESEFSLAPVDDSSGG